MVYRLKMENRVSSLVLVAIFSAAGLVVLSFSLFVSFWIFPSHNVVSDIGYDNNGEAVLSPTLDVPDQDLTTGQDNLASSKTFSTELDETSSRNPLENLELANPDELDPPLEVDRISQADLPPSDADLALEAQQDLTKSEANYETDGSTDFGDVTSMSDVTGRAPQPLMDQSFDISQVPLSQLGEGAESELSGLAGISRNDTNVIPVSQKFTGPAQVFVPSVDKSPRLMAHDPQSVDSVSINISQNPSATYQDAETNLADAQGDRQLDTENELGLGPTASQPLGVVVGQIIDQELPATHALLGQKSPELVLQEKDILSNSKAIFEALSSDMAAIKALVSSPKDNEFFDQSEDLPQNDLPVPTSSPVVTETVALDGSNSSLASKKIRSFPIRPKMRPGQILYTSNLASTRPKLRPNGLAVEPSADTSLAIVASDEDTAASPVLTLRSNNPKKSSTDKLVVGIFVTPSARWALVRLPGGNIERVTFGGHGQGWQVTQIERDHIVVEAGQTHRKLIVGDVF